MQPKQDTVYYEAVLRSDSGGSMFAQDTTLEPDTIDDFKPAAGQARQAAAALESLGMIVRHIGTYSISGEVPRQRRA